MRILTLTVIKFHWNSIFFQRAEKEIKTVPILFWLVYQGVFGHFPKIPDNFRRFPKTTPDCRRRKISRDRHSSFELSSYRFPRSSWQCLKDYGLFTKNLQTLNIIFSGNSKQPRRKNNKTLKIIGKYHLTLNPIQTIIIRCWFSTWDRIWWWSSTLFSWSTAIGVSLTSWSM